VGKRFALGQGSNTRPDIEIVGLARDAAYSSVRQAPPPQFFLPHRQAERGAPTFFFYVRAVSDARPLVDAIRPLVNRLAPNLPVINLRTMEDQIAQGMTGDRLAALFTAAFAALATLLAGVGLYAVLAYGVARRSREIGIRIALGATRGTIRRSVLGQVGRITTAGVLLGSGAALGLARWGESFLFGLEGAQAGVLAAAVAAVVVVTVAAAILPVRRAVSVNPVEALRAE
jgi:predicted lysophospholipase L1 biosynthesis ABC-type transport system permease subunit